MYFLYVLVLIILSLVLYLISLQFQVPSMIFLSMNFFILSSIIYFSGYKTIGHLIIPILLLFMLIPIPNQVLSMVTASLQLKVSEVSEIIVRIFYVPVLREGNVLHIPSKSFQVVDACSGIRSLISMATLSLIIGYFTLNKTLSTSMLFLLSFPIAVFINIIRVVTLVLAYHYFSIDLATGFSHKITGLVLFVIGLCMLFASQRILELWETQKINN